MNQDDDMGKRMGRGRLYVASYVTHGDRPIVKRLPAQPRA